jgi:hypothetical protein
LTNGHIILPILLKKGHTQVTKLGHLTVRYFVNAAKMLKKDEIKAFYSDFILPINYKCIA